MSNASMPYPTLGCLGDEASSQVCFMGCKVYKIKIAIAECLENNFISFLDRDCDPFIIKSA
jgi:hypothetical protein